MENRVEMIIVVKYVSGDRDQLVTCSPLNVATGTELSLIAHVVIFQLFFITFENSRPQICFVDSGNKVIFRAEYFQKLYSNHNSKYSKQL